MHLSLPFLKMEGNLKQIGYKKPCQSEDWQGFSMAFCGFTFS